MTTNDLFWGSREKDATTAADFIKAIKRAYRGSTEDEKLEAIVDHFPANSVAMEWFSALDATKKATWAVFVREFEDRFKPARSSVKPRAQLLAELMGMRITLEELAKDHVMVQGEKVEPFVDFVARVRDAVSAASAGGTGEGVWFFHRALPTAIRGAVGDAPDTWDRLLLTMDRVSATTIEAAVEGHKCQKAMEMSMDQLVRRVNNVHIAPVNANPPVVVHQQAGAPPAQQANPQNPQQPNVQGNGGGGRGGAGRERARIPQGTDEQKVRLRQLMEEGIRLQPADTPEGRAAYANQIAAWNAVNGRIPAEQVALWSTGYPISPGTAMPCSGECWRCGMLTNPAIHQQCPTPLIPPLERRYRATCGQWFGRINAPARMVNFVEVEGAPWYAMAGGGDDGDGGGEAGFVEGQRV